MSDTGSTGEKQEEAILRLFQASFPDVRCLRCGYERLYSIPQPASVAGLETVALACARCGHIEQHLASILTRAQKPVPILDPLGDKSEAK